MVRSRTSTASWKAIRRKMIRRAREADLVACPLCQRVLDYDSYQQPDSAEVDHVVSVAQGGTDELSNLTVICRRCNQSKGDGSRQRDTKMDAAARMAEENAREYPLDAEWLNAVLSVMEEE